MDLTSVRRFWSVFALSALLMAVPAAAAYAQTAEPAGEEEAAAASTPAGAQEEAAASAPAGAQEEAATAVAAPQEEADISVQQTVQEEAGRRIEEKRNLLITEAISAMEATERALQALDEGNTQPALEALALATGKLELVVTRDPQLALAPVEVAVYRRDILADLRTIREARAAIEELVADGQLQRVRPLIRDFGSEIVIETTNLPLATYPEAIKLATLRIDQGDIEGAKRILTTALSTLVITESVMPLPIVRAEALLQEAEAALNEPATATAAASEEAQTVSESLPLAPAEYIEAARRELELAEALAYGADHDYADLRENLEELEKRVEQEQETGSLFRTITENFDKLRSRIFGAET